ncbi:MAG: indolepyruvate ferredoxin oxidoreductase subunit alpha [Halodesulfurarchaeum sp.]
MLDGNPGDTDLLLGNEAIARGALEAGVGAVSAYPGTPSTEIGDSLREVADAYDRYMEYSINEKVALETAIAASLSGVRAMAVMKHVGLNVASDSFMALAHSGVEAGLVLVVADDPNMWSSQNEQDTRNYAQFAKVPIISPATPAEAKEVIPYAYDLSEDVGTPVIVRSTTRISHSRGPVTLGEVPEVSTSGSFQPDHVRTVHIPAHGRQMKPELLDRREDARAFLEDSPFNWTDHGEGEVGILACGIAYNYVREALDWMDRDEPVLKLSTPHPLPTDRIDAFLEGLDSVLVVEELDPIVEKELRVLAQREGLDVEISGKLDDVVPMSFELATEHVAQSIADFLGVDPPVDFEAIDVAQEEAATQTVPRPPELCPGCPHERVFTAMQNLLDDDDAIYPGDIGCYTLGVNYGTVDIQFAMGAGTGFAAGFPHFTDQTVVATIGDSTFYHAGIPGLLNAIYNDADTTVVVLDNRTTAMTGHQPNPSTGWRATGEDADRIPIEDIAEAAGADFVDVVTPYDLETVEETLEAAIDTEGVSVVVARAPCVLFKQDHGERLAAVDSRGE